MNASYHIVLDQTYCRNLVDRYRRQQPFFIRPAVVALLPLVVLTVAGLLFARTNEAFQPFLPWLAVLLLASSAVDYFVLRQIPVRRLMKRAGDAITYTLTDKGIEAVGPLAEGKLEWAAYPRSVRFADGFLLLRAKTTLRTVV